MATPCTALAFSLPPQGKKVPAFQHVHEPLVQVLPPTQVEGGGLPR